MKASNHARYCQRIARELYTEFNKMSVTAKPGSTSKVPHNTNNNPTPDGEVKSPVLSNAICSRREDDHPMDETRSMVYCHPDDEDKDYVDQFDYPHREL
jgi:hypothetical protein